MLDVGNSKRKDPDGECSVILWKYWRLGMWLRVRAESREEEMEEEMMAETPAQVFQSQEPS